MALKLASLALNLIPPRAPCFHAMTTTPAPASTFAGVHEFSDKAASLMDVEHHARAAEKWGRAIEAAQAVLFGSGDAAAADDCLVVAFLRAKHCEALSRNTRSRGGVSQADAAKTAAVREALFTVLPAAQAAVQRRRAAGTLLGGGTPRADAERAWFETHIARKAARRPHEDAAHERTQAPLFGYIAYLQAVDALNCALSVAIPAGVYCDEATTDAQVAFVVSGLDLMATAPRPVWRNEATVQEMAVVMTVRKAVAVAAGDPRPAARAVRAGWLRLQTSGVLRARGLDAGVDRAVRAYDAACDAAKVAAGPEQLRRCALPSCGATEPHPSCFKHCGACKTVVYCSKVHQAEDWARHKPACKAARAASR
jgi:hypothetical protein